MVLRVTAQYLEVAASGGRLGVRVAAQTVEVAGTVDQNPDLRVSAQTVEVAGTVDLGQRGRITAVSVDVLHDSPHRNLTSVLGTIASGLATHTLQYGAGSQAPSFFEPENTGQVGSRSSLAGAHLVPGRSLATNIPSDTGVIGISDSILNRTHILAFPANVNLPGERFGNADNTIVATQSLNVGFSLSVSATTDINIDGTWSQTATSSIKSVSASSTIVPATVGDHNQRVGSATTTITGMTVSSRPGLITLDASNTISLTLGLDPGIAEGAASSSISLTQSAVRQTSITSLSASNTISTLTTQATNNVIAVDATTTISLSQSETVAGPLVVSSSSPISLTSVSDSTFGAFGRQANNALDISTTNPDGGIVTSNIRNLQASNDIDIDGTWTSVPRIADTFEVETGNILTLVDVAPAPTGKRSVSADNTLTLLDFADNNVKTRDVVTNIDSLSVSATGERVIRAINVLNINTTAQEGFVNLLAVSPINLTQIARPGAIELTAENTLELSHDNRSSIRMLDATDIIPIADTINVQRPWYVDSESEIAGFGEDTFIEPIGPIIPGEPFGLDHEVSLTVDPVRNPTTFISLIDQAVAVHLRVDAISASASDSIGLIDTANLSRTADADTVIDSLSVAADVNLNTIDPATVIVLDQIATFSINRALLDARSSLNMRQALAFTLEKDTTDCDYSPFVGGGESGIVPPRPTLPEPRVPALPDNVRFRLAYPPFDTGSTIDQIDLRAPEFGNRERLEPTRIVRETMGGDLTVFADPIWPKVHTLQMQFTALKTDQARGMLNFMERWLGQEIGLYDYEGRVWKGVITNPDEAIIHDGKEKYSMTLEMEAERVHQLNRTAISNLGGTLDDAAGQDEALALTAVSLTQTSDYTFTPVQPANELALDLSHSVDYTKVPAGPGVSALTLSGVAMRNSFFRPTASSTISLTQDGMSLDFDDFGNLIHNWDAENTVGASGAALSSWPDTGSSPVTLNATVSQEPTIRDNILNGRRVVEFRHGGGAERLLSASNIPLFDVTNKVGTIFIVTIVREALATGNETILGNNTDKIMLGGTTSTERPVALLSAESTVALETPTSVLGNGTTQLLMIRRSGNNVTFRRNKTAEAGTTFSTNPTPGNEQLYFGGFTAAGNSVDQDIAHVLMYDDALSDADILTIEGLLTAKWGV